MKLTPELKAEIRRYAGGPVTGSMFKAAARLSRASRSGWNNVVVLCLADNKRKRDIELGLAGKYHETGIQFWIFRLYSGSSLLDVATHLEIGVDRLERIEAGNCLLSDIDHMYTYWGERGLNSRGWQPPAGWVSPFNR